MKIYAIDGPCGSSKSASFPKMILDNSAKGYDTVLLLPTTLLIDSLVERFKPQLPGIPTSVISTNSVGLGQTVRGSLVEWFNQCRPEDCSGHLLYATFAGFQGLDFVANKPKRRLIIDEIPKCFESISMLLRMNHQLITKHILTLPSDIVGYSFVRPNSPEMERISKNESDDAVYKVFKDLAERILNPWYECYVSDAQYASLLTGNTKQLKLYSVLKPDIFFDFNTVTIAGARLKKSLLYKGWQKLGVEFRFATGFPSVHEGGDRTTIFYCLEDKWSLTRRRDKPELIKKAKEAIRSELAGAPFLLTTNNGCERADASSFERGQVTPAPVVAHGLNHFRHLNNVVCLGAYNCDNSGYAAARAICGFSSEDVWGEIHFDKIYQGVFRGALRDPENRNPSRLFVMDRRTATMLGEMIPGATIRKLDISVEESEALRPVGRKKVYVSDAEKSRAYRMRKNGDLVEVALEPDLLNQSYQTLSYQGKYHDLMLKYRDSFVTKFYGTLWNAVISNETCRPIELDTMDEFDDYLLSNFKMSIDSKESANLFCPSFFVKSSDSPLRNSKHTIFSKNIIVDVEDSSILPRQWPELFPHLRMTVCSTYRSTEKLPRYRVIVYTDGPIIGNEDYKAICRLLTEDVKSQGYHAAKVGGGVLAHGIDGSKSNPYSLFYLPSQPEDPSGAFFEVFKDGQRKPLNVLETLKRVNLTS